MTDKRRRIHDLLNIIGFLLDFTRGCSSNTSDGESLPFKINKVPAEIAMIKSGKLILGLTVVLLLTFCSTQDKNNHAGLMIEQEIKTKPGFEVQLLYKVPRDEQGSWISLAVDPKGRLIASDEQGKGLFRITIDKNSHNPRVSVEKIINEISGAQGLLWADNQLYANVNGKGLYRIKDTDGDNQFDEVTFLGGADGQGEHGNHAVLSAEDSRELYLVYGNRTPMPNIKSDIIANWENDVLLEKSSVHNMIGGYIVRADPDGNNKRMVSIGHRNIYDAAVNQKGELFTFDSDTEGEMGLPWYRPTRVVHVVSGSDYGWKEGSGKWETYFEDTLPPLLNIGRGSPTGLLFGTGAKFPERYQRALYGLDWVFGTIYAFHLTPEGASYSVEKAEEFVTGNDLPLTDAVIGKDGAMYFITGGRNKESRLYRLVFRGNDLTTPVKPKENPNAKAARKKREKLEAFHNRQDPTAADIAWPHLNSHDRFIRHAARLAIEAQPTQTWADRILTEERPQARITGMVALARTGSEDYRDDAINSLLELDEGALSVNQKLGYLRAMSLIFMRLGDPLTSQRKQITNTLLELLPSNNSDVNTELIRLLVYLDDDRVVEKAVALIRKDIEPAPPEWVGQFNRRERYVGTMRKMMYNPPPLEKLKYAYLIRTMKTGWSKQLHIDYFSFINYAANAMGGDSYTGFLKHMRDEALSNTAQSVREAVANIINRSLVPEKPFEVKPVVGPGQNWTLDEAVKTVEGHLDNRNFERGRNAFFSVGCASCHRFDGYGGGFGPTLDNLGMRASVTGILEDIIKPSSFMPDPYRISNIKLKNGETISGLVLEQGDNVLVLSIDPNAPPKSYLNDEIAEINPLDVSIMPAGLINPISSEELRDLIAYLKSGGDPKNKMFKNDGNETD